MRCENTACRSSSRPATTPAESRRASPTSYAARSPSPPTRSRAPCSEPDSLTATAEAFAADDLLARKLGHFAKLSSEDKRAVNVLSTDRIRHVGAREDILRERDPPTGVKLI